MSILGRKVSNRGVVAFAVLFVAVVGLLPVTTKSPAREITLVAKDMAFYLPDDPKNANPVLEVKAGETIRVVLLNRDRGMTHDFTVPASKASTKALQWNEEDEVTFDVPEKPGTYEYICQPHVVMMKGTLRVIR